MGSIMYLPIFGSNESNLRQLQEYTSIAEHTYYTTVHEYSDMMSRRCQPSCLHFRNNNNNNNSLPVKVSRPRYYPSRIPIISYQINSRKALALPGNAERI